MRRLTVLRTGPLALIQDTGRPGNAHLGVPPSGALDAPALAAANHLVGNAPGAAGIEVLLGGLRVRAECACAVVVTGAVVPLRVVAADGTESTVDCWTPVRLAAGDVLRLGSPRHGLRSYLAVSGGLAVPAELGSRSTDLLSGLGPAPLSDGDLLPLGEEGGDGDVSKRPTHVFGTANTPVRNCQHAGRGVVVPVLLGPRDDWFEDASGQLAGAEWTVSPVSNRVGLRLDGTRLRRTAAKAGVELASEGAVTGAVQVPPDGHPVIFLADHPTTGGYPVIAVVDRAALPLLAQVRPGSRLQVEVSG